MSASSGSSCASALAGLMLHHMLPGSNARYEQQQHHAYRPLPPPRYGAGNASDIRSILYAFPLCGGTVPLARWAQASAAVGPVVYFYGGVGHGVLDELVALVSFFCGCAR